MIQEEIITKTTLNNKFKIIDNKIEQNQAQYNLDIQSANISLLGKFCDLAIDSYIKRYEEIRKLATAIQQIEFVGQSSKN